MPETTRHIAVVLPIEADGAEVYVDDVAPPDGPGGQTVRAVSNGAHAVADFDLVIGSDCTDAYTYVKVTHPAYKPYWKNGVLLRPGAGPSSRQIRIGVGPDPGRPGDTILVQGLEPLSSPSRYALQGRLGITATGGLKDATGPRRGMFATDMPILNVWDSDPDAAKRSNRILRDCGWQGHRLMIQVSNDFDIPPTPEKFWYGRAVSHQQTQRHFVRHLDDMAPLGLKVGLTKGTQYRSDQEEYDRLAEVLTLAKVAGHAETVAWVEVLGNEAIINHKYGRMGHEVPNPDYNPSDPESRPTYTDFSAAVAYAQPLAKLVREILPGCLVSMGSFDESGTTLQQIAQGMDLVDIHHDRAMPNGIKHIHTAWDFCHYQRKVPGKGLLQGENGGLNDPYRFGTACGNLSTPINDPDLVFTLTAVEQLTNQITVYLNGPMIRHWCEIDTCWGVKELPDKIQAIPDDIGTWQGRSFFRKGDEFVWAGLTEWGQMQRPPFTVGAWRAVSAFTDVQGEGLASLVAAMTAPGYIVRGQVV